MSMSKPEILCEAAAFIEEEAQCLKESCQNARTGEIEDPEILAKWRREMWLASKLRSYASEKTTR